MQRRGLGGKLLEFRVQRGNGLCIARRSGFKLLLPIGGLELRGFDVPSLLGNGGNLFQQRIERFGPLRGDRPQGLLQGGGRVAACRKFQAGRFQFPQYAVEIAVSLALQDCDVGRPLHGGNIALGHPAEVLPLRDRTRDWPS